MVQQYQPKQQSSKTKKQAGGNKRRDTCYQGFAGRAIVESRICTGRAIVESRMCDGRAIVESTRLAVNRGSHAVEQETKQPAMESPAGEEKEIRTREIRGLGYGALIPC
ncbi:hypothetical protein L1887_17659 [Cichorium endivia]|nr:hypothetical protein L1887_17659 [Cichorium endivia]